MTLALISAPYHLGHPAIGMALGPGRILEALGGGAAAFEVGAPSVSHEVGATFEVDASIAEAVRAAVADRRLPVVLSANCIAAAGTVAGLATAGRLGVVWLDAHGDFNTAETTPSGYVDGMAIAVAAGREWQRIAASIPGFRPVDPRNVVHVGGRDFDAGEAEALRAAGAEVISTETVRSGALARSFGRLAAAVDAVYLHLDLDVIDESEGRANAFACAGGLTRPEFVGVVRSALSALPVRAIGFAAYDPTCDPDGRIATIAAEAIRAS